MNSLEDQERIDLARVAEITGQSLEDAIASLRSLEAKGIIRGDFLDMDTAAPAFVFAPGESLVTMIERMATYRKP